jgi:hypothetical protein
MLNCPPTIKLTAACPRRQNQAQVGLRGVIRIGIDVEVIVAGRRRDEQYGRKEEAFMEFHECVYHVFGAIRNAHLSIN